MHDQPSLPLRLHTANGLRVLRFVDAVKHEVVLLIQATLLPFMLQADAVQVHVLDWSQLIAVLGSGHLALMEVHGGEALAVAAVYSASAQLILVTVLIAGPCGTGKSHLAQPLGYAAARQGYDVLFQLMARLRTAPAMGTP